MYLNETASLLHKYRFLSGYSERFEWLREGNENSLQEKCCSIRCTQDTSMNPVREAKNRYKEVAKLHFTRLIFITIKVNSTFYIGHRSFMY